MTTPAFSIVIPHLDDRRGLARTLAALAVLDPESPPLEVVVVDNGSACGIASVERIVAGSGLAARVVTESRRGAGPARNRGAASARGEYLLFLDCDCMPAADWLGRMADALAQHAIVGGPVLVTVSDVGVATPTALFDLLFGFQSRRSFARDGLLLSGNLATARSTFGRIGPFLTGLSEDREWCVRARAMGHDLALQPDAPVRHAALDDEAALDRRWMRVTREAFAFYRAEGRSRFRWLAYCLIVGLSPLGHWTRIFVDNRLRGVSFDRRLAVLRLLCRIRWRRAMLGLRLAFAGDPAVPRE